MGKSFLEDKRGKISDIGSNAIRFFSKKRESEELHAELSKVTGIGAEKLRKAMEEGTITVEEE